jgi:hypothetical protein
VNGPREAANQALMSQLDGVGSARRGRPRASWEQCVVKDLASLGLPTAMHDLAGACAIRGAWRSMLYKITHPNSEGFPFVSRSHAAHQRHTSHMRWRAEWLAGRGMHSGPRALSDCSVWVGLIFIMCFGLVGRNWLYLQACLQAGEVVLPRSVYVTDFML